MIVESSINREMFAMFGSFFFFFFGLFRFLVMCKTKLKV